MSPDFINAVLPYLIGVLLGFTLAFILAPLVWYRAVRTTLRRIGYGGGKRSETGQAAGERASGGDT